MSRRRIPISALAERELGNCCAEGLDARRTRLRLARCGTVLSERSVCRRMKERREAEAAEQRRARDLEAIGRGFGAVQIGATGATEILRTSVPDWRDRQAATLRELLEQFLKRPTGRLYAALAVGLHSFLLSEVLEKRDA